MLREIMREDTLRKDTTRSEHKGNTYQDKSHPLSRMNLEEARENLTSKKILLWKIILKRALHKKIQLFANYLSERTVSFTQHNMAIMKAKKAK